MPLKISWTNGICQHNLSKTTTRLCRDRPQMGMTIPVRRAMKPSLKYTVLFALVILAVQYWTLAIISDWLTCDDSKAVEVFSSTHRFVACLAGLIWGADSFGGRYIVIFVLGILGWWVIKQKQHEPHA